MIWLSGGASHIDTWDMKPDAPLEYRGPFRPMPTSAPGIEMCEHLPHLAKQAHHLAIVRSLGDHGRGTGDHHAGYYYNLTGHAPDRSFHQLLNARTPYPTDWPSMASVVAFKRPAAPEPSLGHHAAAQGRRARVHAARPVRRPAGHRVRPGVRRRHARTAAGFHRARPVAARRRFADRMPARRQLLAAIERPAARRNDVAAIRDYRKHQQRKAFTLLTSRQTKNAFDLAAEPQAVREKYGPGINAMSMLLARRLVEAGVPFVTVFWKGDKELDTLCKSGGGWDTHGNNFNCLKDRLLPEFDRPFAALLDDLHQRGLLDETLVLVSSEMGRKPKIGDPRSGGPAARAATTGPRACRCCWPAAASAAGRPTAPATRRPNFPPTIPWARSTSPAPFSTRWASTTCTPPTAKAGRSI